MGCAELLPTLSIGVGLLRWEQNRLSTAEIQSNGHSNGRPDDRLTKPAPQPAQAVVWAASWRKNTSVRAYSGELRLSGHEIEKTLRAQCVQTTTNDSTNDHDDARSLITDRLCPDKASDRVAPDRSYASYQKRRLLRSTPLARR